MKIVQINETCGQGSTGKLALELNEGYISKGNESYIFYAMGQSDYQYAFKISNRRSQILHAGLSRIFGLQGYFSFFSTLELVKKLKNINPDVVHLHNLHGNYINLRILFNYLINNKIATVITLHDCWFFTGKCTHFVATDCKKWKTECCNCPQLHIDNVNPTYLFDRTRKCYLDKKNWYQKLDKLGVVGVSDWISTEAKKSILDIAKIVTIYNWVDPSVFYIREKFQYCDEILKSINNKKIVLMVSTGISEQKWYNEMLYLSKELGNQYKLVCVGKNDYNLTIPDNVIHIECTSNQEHLAELYSRAYVCVNTTKYETFGMVSVEAMACGTPVIVYNNTGSKTIVPEGCGYVIDEDGGYELIKKKIERISIGSDLLKSNEISDLIHTKYSKEKAIESYLNLYRFLI